MNGSHYLFTAKIEQAEKERGKDNARKVTGLKKNSAIPIPWTKRQVFSLLGLINFFSKFIHRYKVECLSELTGKNAPDSIKLQPVSWCNAEHNSGSNEHWTKYKITKLIKSFLFKCIDRRVEHRNGELFMLVI